MTPEVCRRRSWIHENLERALAVTIHNLTSNYMRQYTLGRWSAKATAVTAPGRKRARR